MNHLTHIVWGRTLIARILLVSVFVVGLGSFIHFRFVLTSPDRACVDCTVVFDRSQTPKKYVALTFDDGPAGAATDRILAVLREHNAPATFFVVGENVAKRPEQVRTIFEEGHLIGNHTYSHGGDVHASQDGIVEELNRTNTLVETITGRSAVLYRPPYLMDVKPFSVTPQPQDGEVWRWVYDAGYVPVGIDTDSDNWAVQTREEAIEEARVAVSEMSTQYYGFSQHVMLFHDVDVTADALPEIIRMVRAEGFEIVPLTQVLGVSYDVAMPPAHSSFSNQLNRGVLASLEVLIPVFLFLMVIMTIVAVLRLVVFSTYKIRQRATHVRHSGASNGEYTGSISVLVPAYNEAENIRSTIRSLLSNSRVPDEILVIDDGSSDDTLKHAHAVAREYPQHVRVITKANGGKASALNTGIATARGDVLVAIDGDTVLHHRCIEELTRPFSQMYISATAGKILPASVHTFLEKVQRLEYLVGQNIDKELIGEIGSVNVVPGAVGAWRKEVLRRVGGYSEDTLVEDQDLTLAMLRVNTAVTYVPTALAYTEVPVNVRSFYLQRFRWVYGTFQCMWKYRHYFCGSESLRLGWVALPYSLIFNVIVPVASLALNAVILTQFVLGMNTGVYWFLAVFIVLDVSYAYLALRDESPEVRRSLLYVIPQRFIYLVIYSVVVTLVLVKVIDGSRTRWNKLKRTGSAERYFKEHGMAINLGPVVQTTT